MIEHLEGSEREKFQKSFENSFFLEKAGFYDRTFIIFNHPI